MAESISKLCDYCLSELKQSIYKQVGITQIETIFTPMETLEITNAFLEARDVGVLRLADAGMAFKMIEKQKVISFKKDDLREIEFHRSVQEYNMRIRTNKDEFCNITNIPESEVDTLRTFISEHFKCAVFVRDLEFQNVFNGRLHLTDEFLEFKKNSKLIFDMHLKAIKNLHYAKNELTLSFDDQKDSIVEIKFFNENPNLVEELKESLSKSGSVQEEIVTFSNIPSVVPRARCDYIFYSDIVRIVGSTYEHKIRYKSIKNIFILEKDAYEDYCVLEIDPPIRQGQTHYSYIALIFSRELEEEFVLKITPEIKSKFPMLQTSYSGILLDSFSSVLKAVISESTKIIRTGEFQTLTTKRCWLKCSLKAFDGHLYPLPSCLFFLPKAVCMPLRDVRLVEFSRVNISRYAARTFDMKITTMTSTFAFNTISKDDFGPLEQYFADKKIKVTSEVYEDDNISDSSGREEESDYETEESGITD